jgi:hypothetical protein
VEGRELVEHVVHVRALLTNLTMFTTNVITKSFTTSKPLHQAFDHYLSLDKEHAQALSGAAKAQLINIVPGHLRSNLHFMGQNP